MVSYVSFYIHSYFIYQSCMNINTCITYLTFPARNQLNKSIIILPLSLTSISTHPFLHLSLPSPYSRRPLLGVLHDNEIERAIISHWCVNSLYIILSYTFATIHVRVCSSFTGVYTQASLIDCNLIEFKANCAYAAYIYIYTQIQLI